VLLLAGVHGVQADQRAERRVSAGSVPAHPVLNALCFPQNQTFPKCRNNEEAKIDEKIERAEQNCVARSRARCQGRREGRKEGTGANEDRATHKEHNKCATPVASQQTTKREKRVGERRKINLRAVKHSKAKQDRLTSKGMTKQAEETDGEGANKGREPGK
jgi:hypothetical protein